MTDLRSATRRALAVSLTCALAACAGDAGPIGGGVPPPGAPRVVATTPSPGRDHAALLAAFGGEYAAPALKAMVSETVARLVAKSEMPGESYAVTLLDSPKVNAFALPSGRIYVTRGLLALAGDNSELAAVLAHEIAHVVLRHAAARGELEARGALLSRVAADVLGDGHAGVAIRDRSARSLASFSRSQELEADAAGIAMMAAAGYDPQGAPRFLHGLERASSLVWRETGKGGAAGATAYGLSSHPATPERIAAATSAARRLAAPGQAREDRDRYLAAIDGMPYGDRARDGIVRGRSFLHPRLGVAFTAPDGMTLENTSRAVLGANPDGRFRLLFDAVDAPEGQSLSELLVSTWTDPIEPASVRTVVVNGRPVAFASSNGKEWSFRLAAVRIGATIFRLILAGRGAPPSLDRDFEAAVANVREIGPDEAATIRTQTIGVVTAGPGDSAESLAARMTTDRALERFLLLNGIERGAPLKEGRRYKIVQD